MKSVPLWLVAFVAILTITLPSLAVAQTLPEIQQERLEARVTAIAEERDHEVLGTLQRYQRLVLTVTQGSVQGQTIQLETGLDPLVNARSYHVGDEIMLLMLSYEGRRSYQVVDVVRRAPLLWLFGAFILVTLLVGRRRGLMALLGMALSFTVILGFVVPQVLAGFDPVMVALLASLVLIPVTFGISHGWNAKTLAAGLGTLIALAVTGGLAVLFVDAARLSGYASEAATYLQVAKQGALNIRGLLLAGIVIGVLGVLDDITVSQAAVVAQLRVAAPHLSMKQTYRQAMEVGRDHIASLVNTLILVYTGAAMPLLLLFVQNAGEFGEIVNYETVAEEIVRTLVASIGLVIAVPVTTLIACLIVKDEATNAPVADAG